MNSTLLRENEAITPEQLLASLKAPGAMPPEEHQEDVLFWLRTIEHNCNVIIRFCQLELKKLRSADDDELRHSLRETKRLATEALLLAARSVHHRTLRHGRRLKLLGGKYDNLGASIGSIFLLIASDYHALRAEAVFCPAAE